MAFLSFIKNTMSQKRTLVVLCTLFLFSSCSEYLKGKPFRSNVIALKNDSSLECLEDISSDMQKFLDAEATDGQIDNTMTCINKTLTELQAKVQGREEASSFTSAEVYEIMSTFAPEVGLSAIAAENLISMKAALLGGQQNKITKGEIDLLKNYLLVVRDEAKNLKLYVKVFYLENADRKYSRLFIDEAFNALNLSLKRLLAASRLANSNYSIAEFKTLLVNVLNLSDEKKAMADIGHRVVDVLNYTGAAVLTDADRMEYIDNITKALRLYSLYQNNYVKFEINTSVGNEELISYAEEVISLITNSLQFKKTQQISAQTLDALVGVTAASGLLDYDISGYDAAMFYRTILVRVFESGVNGSLQTFTGLKPVHIKNIRKEIGIYKVYSKMLTRIAGEELFAQQNIATAPLGELRHAMAQLNIYAESEILSAYDSQLQGQIVNAVSELRNEFVASNSIVFKNKKFAIAKNQDTWTQRWKDLARALYVKMLARLVMQGWGAIYPLENLSVNYLTEQNMTLWYSEFKKFAVAIKGFDPRVVNHGAASVKTGNLFTRVGNGDVNLTYNELAQNIATLLTSSGSMHEEIYNDLLASNCQLPELDVFDKHWVFESCLHQKLRSNYRLYFSSTPHLVTYLDTLDETQFRIYFDGVLDVVRTDMSDKGKRIETSDITSMNSLLQYIEALYVTHDLNSNWNLSESEIKTAYPKFQNVATQHAYTVSRSEIEDFTSWKGEVAGYGCYSEQDLIRESFVFLVYNGRTPTMSDLNTLACFRGKPLLDFYGEVNRHTMINTFKALKSVLLGQ